MSRLRTKKGTFRATSNTKPFRKTKDDPVKDGLLRQGRRVREERVINGQVLVRVSDYTYDELRPGMVVSRTCHNLGPATHVDTCINIRVEYCTSGKKKVSLGNWSGGSHGESERVHAENMSYLYKWSADIIQMEEEEAGDKLFT